MLFINLLTAALLPAAVVQAAPSSEEFDLEGRTSPSCPSYMYYDTKKKSCKHKYMSKPKCPMKKYPYCAHGKKDWSYYDEEKPECYDDGKGMTFCSEKGKEQEYCDKYCH